MVLRVCRKKERPVENSFVVVFGESSVQLYASSFVLFTTATTRQRNHCDIPPSLGIRILCYFVCLFVFSSAQGATITQQTILMSLENKNWEGKFEFRVVFLSSTQGRPYTQMLQYLNI